MLRVLMVVNATSSHGGQCYKFYWCSTFWVLMVFSATRSNGGQCYKFYVMVADVTSSNGVQCTNSNGVQRYEF